MVHFNKIGRPGVSRAGMKAAVGFIQHQQKQQAEALKRREEAAAARQQAIEEEARRIYMLPENVRDRHISHAEGLVDAVLAHHSDDGGPIDMLAKAVGRLVWVVRELNDNE